MAQITLKGTPIQTSGNLPEIGSSLTNFTLVKTDLSETTLADYAGKRLILNIFPSIDTGICALSAKRFNAETDKMSNTAVLCVSKDLPFAHSRFCEAEGLKNVIPVSGFKNTSFEDENGLKILDGPLAGLMSRAIIIADETGKVIYSEQVPEIVQEPDYEKALAALA